MSLLRYLFNVSPSGTDLSGNGTTGNVVSTPGGVIALNVAKGTGSTVKSSNLHSHSGGLCAELVAASGANAQIRLPFAAANNVGAISVYDYILTALPTTTEPVIVGRSASGASFKIAVTSTGRFTLQDGTGALLGTAQSASGVITANTLLRYEIVFNVTTGALTANVYPGDSTSPINAAPVTNTLAGSIGAAAITAIDIGRPNVTAQNITQYFDDVQLNDGATAEIGPYTATNIPPVVNAGTDQHIPAGSLHLAASATDSDGSISSGAWVTTYGPNSPSVVTVNTGLGTGAVTSTADFAVIPGRYRFTITETDDAGAPSSDAVEVYVYAPSNADVGVFTVTAPLYTLVGAVSLEAAANDALPGSYAETPAPAAGQSYRAVMNPYGPGDITIKVGGYQPLATPPVTVTVRVYKEDGVTLIYTTSFLAPTTDADSVITLDSAALALVPALIDRRALVVELLPTQ